MDKILNSRTAPDFADFVAFNSLRVEPTWMMLGQAAGIAAAMTQKDKRPAQGVNTAELQRRLLEASVPFQKP